MRSEKIGFQLNWKSKTWIFTFLNVYVSWIERGRTLISQPTRMDQRGNPKKMNFDIFEKQKWISQLQLKTYIKKWGQLTSFFFSFLMVMVLKLPKIVPFLQISADLSKISKSFKAIYLYPYEWLHHALSKRSVL